MSVNSLLENEIEILAPFLTPQRKQRIESVLARRTENLGFVLDSLIDQHNISAILRTSEALGLSRVYIVPGEIEKNGFSRAVSKNSHKWLDVEEIKSTGEFLHQKKAEGFTLWLADGGSDSCDLTAITIPDKLLVVMGNEHRGVGSVCRDLADQIVAISIRGFMESYNVSVAAAILAFYLLDHHPFAGLCPERLVELKHRFYKQSVRYADLILRNRRCISTG